MMQIKLADIAAVKLSDAATAGQKADDAPSFVPPAFDPPVRWPGLPGWLVAARRNALELFPADCYSEFGVSHRIAGQSILVLSDPDGIAAVTGSGSADFSLTNMHLRMLGPALGRGVIVAQGDAWRRQRRAALKLVAETRSRPEAPYGDGLVADLVARWRVAAGPVDVQADLTSLSIAMLAEALFHHHSNFDAGDVLVTIGRHRALVERAGLLDVLGAPPWLGSPRLWRARRLVSRFDSDIHAAIASSQHFRPPTELPATARRDMVVNLMAGFESIAVTATWLLGLVAAHPALAAWLTATGLHTATKAARLDSAIAETLRLYPPLPLVYRRARVDHHGPAGRIARGTMVCISPYVVQRHRLLWADPDRFHPARTLPASGAYMPFGLGARQCVGKHLGPRLVARILGPVLAALPMNLAGELPLPRAGLSLRPQSAVVIDFRNG